MTVQPARSTKETAKRRSSGVAGSKPKTKRPLTSYNMYFRFKRQKVLEAVAAGGDRDEIRRIVSIPPGLERWPTGTAGVPTHALNDLRRATIRGDLGDDLLPRVYTGRPHRTDASALNGQMSFIELSGIMNAGWRALDDFSKSVFREVAQEGSRRFLEMTRGQERDDAAIKAKSSGGAASTKASTSEGGVARGCPAARSEDVREKTAETRADGAREASLHRPPPRESERPPLEGHRPRGTDPYVQHLARVTELQARLVTERLRLRVAEIENVLLASGGGLGGDGAVMSGHNILKRRCG